MDAGYKKQKAKLQKNSRRAHYFIYKEKKKKKNTILDVYCVQNFGYKFHIPSKLCLQSTGNKYHNILDAYAGYKKLRAHLEKKSRQAHYFLYKEKKKKLQYLMPIVFRISGPNSIHP